MTPLEHRSTRLLAAPRHTLTLFGILLFLVVAGAFNASNNVTAHQTVDPNRMVKNDLVMIVLLWFWVYFVYKGMREQGRSILEFFDFKSLTPTAILGDCAAAVLVFALIYACSHGVHLLVPDHATQANNPLLSAKPSGLFEMAVWIAVSVSAGISEEIVFRGYLQRQLALLTGNIGIAIVVQGLVFAVGHAYEGVSAVSGIVVHGLFLGLLAYWRGNIRAGILVHAGWDILAGFDVPGM